LTTIAQKARDKKARQKERIRLFHQREKEELQRLRIEAGRTIGGREISVFEYLMKALDD
jgi:hypothetical protein